jgi:hypothetical protein
MHNHLKEWQPAEESKFTRIDDEPGRLRSHLSEKNVASSRAQETLWRVLKGPTDPIHLYDGLSRSPHAYRNTGRLAMNVNKCNYRRNQCATFAFWLPNDRFANDKI